MKKLKRKNNDFNLAQYGSIVFGIGLLVAIIAGFFSLGTTSTKVVVGLLVLLGLFVGFLNITLKESVPFLVSSIALVILLGPFLGLISQYFFQADAVAKIFGNLVAFIVPAAIVVALKTLFDTAKDE